MKKVVVLSAIFIGLCIVFSGSLISYNLKTVGSDFLIGISFLLGFLLLLVILLLCGELIPNDLLDDKKQLSESEKKFLEDNDIDVS